MTDIATPATRTEAIRWTALARQSSAVLKAQLVENDQLLAVALGNDEPMSDVLAAVERESRYLREVLQDRGAL